MPAYSVPAKTNESTQGPKLRKGRIKIVSTVDIFWVIGENPVASRERCALLRAGETLELNLPVGCSRLAVLALCEDGNVNLMEIVGGAKASCSA